MMKILCLCIILIFVQSTSQWSKFKYGAQQLIEERIVESQRRQLKDRSELPTLDFVIKTKAASKSVCSDQLLAECKELNEKSSEYAIDFCDPNNYKVIFIRGKNIEKHLCSHVWTVQTDAELTPLVDLVKEKDYIKEITPEFRGYGSGDSYDTFIHTVDQTEVNTNDCVLQTNASWGQTKINNVDADITSVELDQDVHSVRYDSFPGLGVRMYVMDSGLDSTWKNDPEFVGRVEDGWSSYATDTTEEFTSQSHGTFVAGCALGKQFGIAKYATLIPIKVLQPDASSSVGLPLSVHSVSDWEIELQKVQDDCDLYPGTKCVLNMSLSFKLGCWNPTSTQYPCSFSGNIHPDLLTAMENLTDTGVVVVASAGNGDEDCDKIWPAGDPNSITVTGVAHVNGELHHRYNWGSSVDIFAPSNKIMSTDIGGSVTLKQGTSFAAPYVAGVIATMMTEVDFSTVLVENYRTFIMNKFETDTQWGVWDKVVPKNVTPLPKNLFVQHQASCHFTIQAGTGYCRDGDLTKHSMNISYDNVSRELCHAKCLEHPTCVAVGYRNQNNKCYLYDFAVRGKNNYYTDIELVNSIKHNCDIVQQPFISVGTGWCANMDGDMDFLTSIVDTSELTCKEACIKNLECSGYNYGGMSENDTFEQSKICYLFSSADEVLESPNQPGSCMYLNRYTGIARQKCEGGAALVSQNGSSMTYSKCEQLCTNDETCTGFSYRGCYGCSNKKCTTYSSFQETTSSEYDDGTDMAFVCYKQNDFNGFLAKFELAIGQIE